jgi:hypothetical protein
MAKAASNLPASAPPREAIALLCRWLRRAVKADAYAWLEAEIARQQETVDEQKLAVAVGLATRKVGHTGLTLSADEIAAARSARADWRPEHWTTDEAARVTLLLATHQRDDQAFASRIDRLCMTAEVAEHTACLKGFAIFPAPRLLDRRAREGVRSAIQPLFEAIACRNPYPADYFDEAAWNQMVVKCVFVGAPIETIVRLHERRNGELIQMLRDLVAERRSAGRTVPQAVLDYVE